MKSKKVLATIMALAVVGTTLAGCGSKKPKENTAASQLDKDQYLNVLFGTEPQSLDGSKATDAYSTQILSEITEGLTRNERSEDGTWEPKPAGAKNWDVSEDGLTWTFHLRDYNWTDGQKVKAGDFEYGIERTLNPDTGSAYAYLLYVIKGAQAYNTGKGKVEDVGVEAVDDNTLKITLERPTAYFLQLTYFKTMLPQRKDFVEKYGKTYGTEANTLPVCGPFTLSKWEHKSGLTLTKNDKYWDKDKVKLQTVNMKIIEEKDARMQELENGSIDSANVTDPNWQKRFEATKKFTITKGLDGTVVYSFFNQKRKLFSNAKVRQAFSLAYDKEGIIKAMYDGLGTAAYSWVPPQLQIGNDEYRKVAGEEPLKALKASNPDPKALLVEGLKELKMDPDPSKLTVSILEGGTDSWYKQFGEFEQQMYEKTLGVKIKLENVDWGTLDKRINSSDFDITGMAWGPDYNDPMTMFDMWVTGAGIVNAGWSNKTYDDIVAKAGKTTDQKERLELFKQAENILVAQDAVCIPFLFRGFSTFRYKYVKNLYSSNFSGVEFKYAYTQGRPAK